MGRECYETGEMQNQGTLSPACVISDKIHSPSRLSHVELCFPFSTLHYIDVLVYLLLWKHCFSTIILMLTFFLLEGRGVSALDLVTILAIFANLVLTRSEPCRATPYSLPCHLVAVLS